MAALREFVGLLPIGVERRCLYSRYRLFWFGLQRSNLCFPVDGADNGVTWSGQSIDLDHRTDMFQHQRPRTRRRKHKGIGARRKIVRALGICSRSANLVAQWP